MTYILSDGAMAFAKAMDVAAERRAREAAFEQAIMALPAGLGCRRARVSDCDFTFNPMGVAGRTNGR